MTLRRMAKGNIDSSVRHCCNTKGRSMARAKQAIKTTKNHDLTIVTAINSTVKATWPTPLIRWDKHDKIAIASHGLKYT